MGSPDSLRRLAAPAAVLAFAIGSLFAASSEGKQAEGHAFTGEPLHAAPLSDAVRASREAELALAREKLASHPEDASAIIWVGRRTAYLGRYREAVEIYGGGLELHPDEPRLYRHRGHRYITLRRLDAAIADLERAAELVAGTEDRIEPDGLPNARNIPTSTLHSNIWYHLGLAYYLKGDFENAARCYAACMKVSNNPDMLCATTHWFYMTLRRLGQHEKAEALLEPIHEEMEILENGAYHELLLMYKGQRSFEELERKAFSSDNGIDLATLGYALGAWEWVHARTRSALEIFRRVVKGEQWAAFGHLAAEAELSRFRGRNAG